MYFIRELIKFFVAAISPLIVMAGGFLAIAGPISGLGSRNVLVRIGLCLGGIVLVFIGVFGLEVSNAKGGARGGIANIINSLLG